MFFPLGEPLNFFPVRWPFETFLLYNPIVHAYPGWGPYKH